MEWELIFVIELIHKFVNSYDCKKKQNQPEYDKQANINTAENTASLDSENGDELVAVISAAIAAMLNIPGHDFIVKSIKRLPSTTPKWNSIGRQEQIHSRL